MATADFGVVGLAVMGRNLALNVESRGYTVAVYNRSSARTEDLVQTHSDKKFVPGYTVEEFVKSIKAPRRILLMVKAGAGTDAVIEELLPFLEKGDILIDGGNTFFEDTMRRSEKLAQSGINFIGMGVSGGELGALQGPSMMPGGQRDAYDLVEPILKEIAAKAPEDGKPTVAYIGPNGAGHYVKMVHNGIEYGDMQLIAESYDLLKRLLKLDKDALAGTFAEWNKGELDSYLIEITADILTRDDDLGSGKPMVDMILDRAGNKGTGKWSSQSALEVGAPQSLITESVYARYISAMKDDRVAASKVLAGPEFSFDGDVDATVEDIREALYFGKIMSYAQGFDQLRMASDHYDWDLQYGELAQLWRAGAIIRARFLQRITDAYDNEAGLHNLLLDPYFKDVAEKYQAAARRVIALATAAGVPVPSLSAAVAYFDSYRSEVLPANLIQAQRDYFGAHTYERTDKPAGEMYHYSWYEEA
ncbi:NADP-dependent phosphogluconate dehydrogenase [Weissella cibaria]|jgi:6-phosphogluconate dehydrogenase, decarboxylating|uniref:6-phosphogluconate dehydrogenase, decarboxylating n=1 Tax=Weissella cibaria TaxID=137591 RepID=A0A0D1KA46_9LACO|nr:NADP-dependent phosphogluconate dehydrogenase [Weissella cibaria]KIU21894.1 6-phosphogluconate dehydrogenase, decarboxylating [Weissella cibaria]MBD1501663.1 NADP-dependent phosphogluconate dehydrogenase [Weissella cibaria]MCA1356118.1 NADP-dependent phosphogluconate dehydrogenase [Weissella cibaria]MCG4287252.1 NADP-dependent phosphogluconate dehydrogenase [Weissella cibaria]MCS8560539.1 NADP-dependent phosphogluconate dehydrogenase [Weissella cibaria]